MSINKTLAVAALAGLMSTAYMAPAFAGNHDGGTAAAEHKNSCKGKASCAGEKEGAAAAKEKHACKGQNSCKGNGGDGKNACKGHGSCATDGSK